MKLWRALFVGIALIAGAMAGYGCNADSGKIGFYCPTDPTDIGYDDIGCVDIRSRCPCAVPGTLTYERPECSAERLRAGPGGLVCPDGGVDGSPGSNPQSADACECLENAPNGFHAPQPFLIGRYDLVPDQCPAELGAFGALQFDDLRVPSPGCPACVCGEPKGTCSPSPNSILIRAASCAEPIGFTVDFNAPASWDGSCTNVHALPAGAECPAGSGILCAQSVYTSALPDPVEECEVLPLPSPSAKGETSKEKPKAGGPVNASTDFPWWNKQALSCHPNEAGDDSLCGPGHDKKCWPKLPEIVVEDAGDAGADAPPQWRYCVRHEDPGIHACPDGSKYKSQYIVYPVDAKIDSRECTACSCSGAGGMCYGTLAVYEDEACSVLINASSLGSIKHDCDDILPPGLAVGSKEMTGLEYVPGKCTPHGGIAIGGVEKDETRAETWCCYVG